MKTHVVKTTPESTLGEAVDLMDLYQVGSLPVVDAEGVLCGMLSESDVIRALIDNAPSFETVETFTEDVAERILGSKEARSLRIGDYMRQPAIHVSEQADLRQSARMLLKRGLKRVPVTDEHNRVVGTLNRIDIIQAVFEENF